MKDPYDVGKEVYEKHKAMQEEFKKIVTAPPCPECRFFNPIIKIAAWGYDGISICEISGDMEHDFSCFREKGKEYVAKVVTKGDE